MENQNSFLLPFLRAYPTPLQYSLPEDANKLFVFWDQNEASASASTSSGVVDVADRETHQKILATFCDLQWNSSKVLMQFWSPSNGVDLSTRHQPFATHLDPVYRSFRSTCYASDCEIGFNLRPQDGLGVVANAFLGNIAMMWLDFRVHKGDPLLHTALQHGFISYFVLPVSNAQGYCVGVVDCYAKKFEDLLEISISITGALQKHGLRPVQPPANQQYAVIGSLKCEIEVALRKLCESHDLSFAQASVVYVDPASSSSVDAPPVKQTFPLSLIVPCVDQDAEDDDDDEYKLDFMDHCASWHMLPLKSGNELAAKALGNYKPHFCSNVYQMTDVGQLPADSGIKKLSCLALCLKCNELDFVFEFFWPRLRNHFTIIESVISRLKQRLPNFKYASGAELEDEASVTEVGGENPEFTIFVGGKLDGLPHILEEGRGNTSDIQLSQKQIEEQFGKTQLQAAKSLNVTVSRLKRKCEDFGIDHWRRTKKTKRKADDSSSRAVVAPLVALGVDTTVSIKVEYQDTVFKIHVSPTFEAVKQEITKRVDLTSDRFEIQYYDEEKDLVGMSSDKDLKECLKPPPTPLPRIYVKKR